jgi:chemotaxis response regulator CheB
VLVVEDDDSFAGALTELLEADGRLQVVGRARDGREGVELAEALRPDVVLMDIVLPVMDGVEATREIRRVQPTMPVGPARHWRGNRLDPDAPGRPVRCPRRPARRFSASAGAAHAA